MNKVLRLLLILVVLGASAAGIEAQQPKKVPRVGLFIPGSRSAFAIRTDAFRQGLRELGYVEGQNILIEYRYGEGRQDRFFHLAKELVHLKVDVIVTVSTPSVLATKKASNKIPIVFVAVGDPVASRFVESLARPGGNITGLTNLSPDLDGKRLELLKEAFPKIVRVIHLRAQGNPERRVQSAALALGLQLQRVQVEGADNFGTAFEAAVIGRAQAMFVSQSPLFITHQKRIIDFAAKSRLPAIYPTRNYTDQGGLMSYATRQPWNWHRAAYFVDKILKGAKPADLPVEQPTKFELVINLKTAKALGVKIPAQLLMEADKVIE